MARLGALAADVNCRYNDRVGNASPQKIRSKLLNELWRRARVRPDWSKVTVSLEEIARATKIPFETARREADFLHNDQKLRVEPGNVVRLLWDGFKWCEADQAREASAVCRSRWTLVLASVSALAAVTFRSTLTGGARHEHRRCRERQAHC